MKEAPERASSSVRSRVERILGLSPSNWKLSKKIGSAKFPIIDIVVVLFLRISRVKIVYTPHDIYSFKIKSNNNLVKLMYKSCNYIIVHNKANKDLLINEASIPDNKISVVAHGNYNHFLHSETFLFYILWLMVSIVILNIS